MKINEHAYLIRRCIIPVPNYTSIWYAVALFLYQTTRPPDKPLHYSYTNYTSIWYAAALFLYQTTRPSDTPISLPLDQTKLPSGTPVELTKLHIMTTKETLTFSFSLDFSAYSFFHMLFNYSFINLNYVLFVVICSPFSLFLGFSEWRDFWRLLSSLM